MQQLFSTYIYVYVEICDHMSVLRQRWSEFDVVIAEVNLFKRSSLEVEKATLCHAMVNQTRQDRSVMIFYSKSLGV